jgi:micrococcal nuclease
MALIRPIRRIVKVACARNLVRRGIRRVAEVGIWGITRLKARRHRRRQPASKAVTIPVATTPQADIWQCASPSEAGRYWASTQGDKFHAPDCRWAAQITPDHRLCIRAREAAIRAGYTPCGACQP